MSRKTRIVQPVLIVNLVETCTIERGIAGERTDSHNVSFPRLPFTK